MEDTINNMHEVWMNLFNYFHRQGYETFVYGWKGEVRKGDDVVNIHLDMQVVGGEKTGERQFLMQTKWTAIFDAPDNTSLEFFARITADYQYFFEHFGDFNEVPEVH